MHCLQTLAASKQDAVIKDLPHPTNPAKFYKFPLIVKRYLHFLTIIKFSA